jgi:hypothetical protein
MAELILAETASVSTPSAGNISIYGDTTANPIPRFVDDAGNNRAIGSLRNFSVASQAPAAATLTYLTGSNLAIPVNKLQVGSMFQWRFNVTKTAAGIALSTYSIVVGTAGTTADAARCSFTKPAGTAAVDEGVIDVSAVIRTIGAAGVMVGEFTLIHNLSATGHAVIPCVCVNTVSAGFDMTVASLIVGLVVTSGAADAITIQMMQSLAWNI